MIFLTVIASNYIFFNLPRPIGPSNGRRGMPEVRMTKRGSEIIASAILVVA